jgi:nucleoside-diphosphate-sugar epimerase
MIVVTGATGLVGSHLLFELVLKGVKVRALYRNTNTLPNVKRTFSYYSKNPDTLIQNIEWIEGDILDLVSLEKAIQGASQVYHTAAIVSFAPSQKRKMLENNIYGTANVVNACLSAKVEKLCHVSSVAAIGHPEDTLLATEDLIWSPAKHRSYYSISKFHSEMEVWRGIEEGLKAVIVNPSIILGPGNWDKGSPAIFSTINNGLKFFTPGSTGYVDVRDVAKIMVQLMQSDISGQRFILNAEDKSYKDVFELVAQSLGKKAPSIGVRRWMAEIAWRANWLATIITRKEPKITREIVASGFNHSSFSSAKIKKELGYGFISIEQSIQDTCRIFLQNKY